jgi:putative hydrolase of the HAD superfamily
VIFDLDDTLVVDEATSRSAMEAVAASAERWFGVCAARFLEDARRLAGDFWTANPERAYCERIGISFEEALYGRLDEEAPDENRRFMAWARTARVEFFFAVLRLQGLADVEAARRAAAEFASVRRGLQRLMPDAREVLARLSRTHRLALLTNGARSIQREKIADAGLSDLFEKVIISGEEGVGKPEVAVFHLLLARLGVSSSEAAMVGNSLSRDILGARNAGIPLTVWLRVAGSEEPADVSPVATIHGLHELPEVVARFS